MDMNHEIFPINIKEYAGRIERLQEEKKEVSEQINTVFEEAENKGINKKALKEALKLLKLDRQMRETHLELTEQYLEQIGN
jgi:uncharacterized protein (UPF0335 family)